jgi:hypothetical protein
VFDPGADEYVNYAYHQINLFKINVFNINALFIGSNMHTISLVIVASNNLND